MKIPPDLITDATNVYNHNAPQFAEVIANTRQVLAEDFADAAPGIKVAVISAALARMVPKATGAYYLAMALVRLAEQEPTA